MTKRSVVSVILLTIFTCGIYQIYWLYVTANELNAEQPEDSLTNYIIAILLSVVTCGIYGVYWFYKFYKKVDSVTGENNILLNFILHIFTGAVVSTAIVQDSINKYI